MKRISLTQNQYALVNDEDFEELNRGKWCAVKDGHTFYAARNIFNKTKRSGRKTILMHRIVLGAKNGQICDHINRNGLDNRRSNLRIASHSLNGLNQRIRKDNTSGFKGVVWNKLYSKWQAQININNKLKYLGLFDTIQEASAAYKKVFNSRMLVLTI